VEIEKDDIGGDTAQKRKGFLTVRGFRHDLDAGILRQDLAEPGAEKVVVVDHDDTDGARHPRGLHTGISGHGHAHVLPRPRVPEPRSSRSLV
jgi:hypothetical protein